MTFERIRNIFGFNKKEGNCFRKGRHPLKNVQPLAPFVLHQASDHLNIMRVTMNHNNHLIVKELKAHHRHRTNRRNPIFLYGPSRSGKTTILRVIEDYLSTIKGIRVFRLDAEDLVFELVKSIRNSGDTKGFYYKFHDYDALLIDNIWVLQGKPRTVEEIFNLFKTFIDKGKLLVIAWDIAPETLLQGAKTIKELSERSITFKMKRYNPLK